MSLFADGAKTSFCTMDVNPVKNFRSSYWYDPDYGLVIKEMEPFLYDDDPSPDEIYTEGITFEKDRNTWPLKNGKLVNEVDYRLKIEVLNACEVDYVVEVMMHEILWRAEAWKKMNLPKTTP